MSTSIDPGDLPNDDAPVLSENIVPDDSPPFTTPKLDIEAVETKIRRNLAYGSGIFLALFYSATFGFYAFGNLSDLGGVIAAFSGLQTLTAAAFGFYFAKSTGGK